MADNDPPITVSPLSRMVSEDGITVRVEIFKLEADEGWTLEVINEAGTSTVWEDPFDSDASAFEAFKRAVEIEGIGTFLDDDGEGWTTIH
ncbi:hypothetical protein EDF56_10779 [Novosphingobium sp. PhB165]|uniref:hypothetical protein n=1 Tax=Novosphingobium sp. PhB165 TaxID=2485105 RepID=UPI00104F3692|nr:hypothetical protein [Novosphingobium sp. PhB165]TCM16500.1 hypothetical protein EDF56_10779 [Novosphingobium sp. PhB165]